MEDRLGIIPPDIRARYEREEMIERCLGKKASLNHALQSEFGEHVDCVLIGPIRSREQREGIPDSVIPERWHIRVDRGAPYKPQFIPITTESGGYREPGPDVLQMLAERDLRRPGVKEALIAKTRTDSPHKAAERALRKEQRIDVLKEDFRAAKRVRSDGGLKKSFQGKRRMKA